MMVLCSLLCCVFGWGWIEVVYEVRAGTACGVEGEEEGRAGEKIGSEVINGLVMD